MSTVETPASAHVREVQLCTRGRVYKFWPLRPTDLFLLQLVVDVEQELVQRLIERDDKLGPAMFTPVLVAPLANSSALRRGSLHERQLQRDRAVLGLLDNCSFAFDYRDRTIGHPHVDMCFGKRPGQSERREGKKKGGQCDRGRSYVSTTTTTTRRAQQDVAELQKETTTATAAASLFELHCPSNRWKAKRKRIQGMAPAMRPTTEADIAESLRAASPEAVAKWREQRKNDLVIMGKMSSCDQVEHGWALQKYQPPTTPEIGNESFLQKLARKVCCCFIVRCIDRSV